MDKQAKNKLPEPTKNKTSLGKREKSEQEIIPDDTDDPDSLVMSEPRKKLQIVTHSNTIERESESVAKMKSEMVFKLSFVQPETACASGDEQTFTVSNDGTVHSFGRNDEGQLGLGDSNDVSVPTPIPNLPKIGMAN